jgi:hypothetical protein
MIVLRALPVVCALTVAAANAEVAAQHVDTASQTVDAWLSGTCGVGGDSIHTATLRAAGERLVPDFVRAFADGPDLALEREIATWAAERFAARRALLARGAGVGLRADDLRRAQGVTETVYVDRALQDLRHRYRAEALRALAVIGGERARSLLQWVATDPESPFAPVARAGLDRLRTSLR